jgi:hypothetical protein
VIAALALAALLAQPVTGAECLTALDAADRRVRVLTAQVASLEAQLRVRSSSTALGGLTVYCPAPPLPTLCAGRPWWVDVATHAGAIMLGGVVVRGLER